MASATENVIQLDNSKCRICLFTKHNLCPLFRRGLSMKVMKLADIKMYEGDGLPSSICLDCELEVKRSTNFIAQIQRADAKWREILAKEKELCGIDEKHKELSVRLPEKEDMYQVASTSQSNILYDQSNILHDQDNMLFEQGNMLHDNNYHAEVENESPMIEIEEFNVKQEIPSFDQFLSEKEEVHSEGDDHYGDVEHGNDQPEDENELNPLDHVDIVEDRSKGHGMELSNDPLGQEEPLIETQRNENETSVDPLTCMKQEVVAMDIDKDTQVPISVQQPALSGPSSSVEKTPVSMEFPIWPTYLTKEQNQPWLVQEKDLSVQSDNNIRERSSLISKSKIKYSNVAAISNESGVTNKLQNSLQHSTKSLNANKKVLLKDKQMKKITTPPLKLTDKLKSDKLYCFICDRKFDNDELFLNHKENEEFICRVCTSGFKCHSELETHIFQHKVYKCKACREEFVCRKNLQLHRQKMHKYDLFDCKQCNKRFSRNSGLANHILIKHSNIEEHCKCIVCGNSYKFPFQLKGHLETAHVPYEHIECSLCNNIYLGPIRLKVHVKTNHLNSDTNVPIRCPTCGKVFGHEKFLSRHLETHDNTVSVCEICGLSIKSKSAMRWHMYEDHAKKGKFFCKICNEQFNTNKLLRRHHSRYHYERLKPSPVFCEICGKEYKTLAVLKKHKLIHSDARPFKCEICGASFKQGVTLSLHSRVHSNVGKFCCSGCDQTFRWKQTFDRHVSKCEAIVGQ